MQCAYDHRAQYVGEFNNGKDFQEHLLSILQVTCLIHSIALMKQQLKGCINNTHIVYETLLQILTLLTSS